MAKVKYPSIPLTAQVKLTISGAFYRELSQLLIEFTKELTQEEYKKCLEKITKKEKASDIKEANLMILTALVYSIELEATNQGLSEEVEIEVADEPV